MAGGEVALYTEQVNQDSDEAALPAEYFTEVQRLLNQLDARPRLTKSPRGLLNRGTLGDFSSVSCFKSLITGLEDILGVDAASAVCLRAGRSRGKNLVEDWGVGHLNLPVEKLGHLLEAALGHDGTRLCAVQSIRERAGTITVQISETICSVGEAPGSLRRCEFTLGAMWGALEELTGNRYEARQTQSILAGGAYEQFTFKLL